MTLEGNRNGRFRATTDANGAVSNTDASLVCVGPPQQREWQPGPEICQGGDGADRERAPKKGILPLRGV
jgi:hypothetical protein